MFNFLIMKTYEITSRSNVHKLCIPFVCVYVCVVLYIKSNLPRNVPINQ
jgi:hypothetical protein